MDVSQLGTPMEIQFDQTRLRYPILIRMATTYESPTYTSGYPLMRTLGLDYPDYRIESIEVTGHVKELQHEGRITLKNGSYITVIHEDYYDRFMELHSADDKDELLTGVSPEALQKFLNGGMI